MSAAQDLQRTPIAFAIPDDPIAMARDIAPILREESPRIDALGQLTPRVVDALHERALGAVAKAERLADDAARGFARVQAAQERADALSKERRRRAAEVARLQLEAVARDARANALANEANDLEREAVVVETLVSEMDAAAQASRAAHERQAEEWRDEFATLVKAAEDAESAARVAEARVAEAQAEAKARADKELHDARVRVAEAEAQLQGVVEQLEEAVAARKAAEEELSGVVADRDTGALAARLARVRAEFDAKERVATEPLRAEIAALKARIRVVMESQM